MLDKEEATRMDQEVFDLANRIARDRAMKRKKAVGREVNPDELPMELRALRLEKIVMELLSRVEHLEATDDARGLSGSIMIGSAE